MKNLRWALFLRRKFGNMGSLGGHVSKTFLLLLICISFSISLKSSAAAANYSVVPEVKKVIVSYAVKDSNMTEAYSKIKSISLSAVDYVQTDGEKTSMELDVLVATISEKLEHEAIYMNKDEIIATIISAINS